MTEKGSQYIIREITKLKQQKFKMKGKVKGFFKGYISGRLDSLLFVAKICFDIDPDIIAEEFN